MPTRSKRRASLPPLLRKLRRALREVADPARAPGMQAYMKSSMPYLGVPVPAMRRVCREVFASYPFADARRFRADVLALWRGARYREERYAAIELAGHKLARGFQTLDTLPMYEHMIVSGAWWDFVDDIATHRIGRLLAIYPKEMRKTMLAWSRSSDLWKRRTAILCQVGFRDRVDLDLLYACIEPSLESTEFFLRKAIGWALRQVAWRDPKAVFRYVKAHERQLSPLSKREALKNIAGVRADDALKKRSTK